jgi:hypothetical protein
MEYNPEILSFITKTAIAFNGGTNYHIALIIFQLFPDIYKTSIVNGKVLWYKKEDDAWISLKKIDFEINTFRNEVANYLDYARSSLKIPNDTDHDYENKYKLFLESMTRMLKLQEKLYSRPFMLDVLKELAELYYDKPT